MSEKHYFTPESERCLIRAAQAGDISARNKLIVGALPFLRRFIRCRYPTVKEHDFEDLVHESVNALYVSLDRYDLEHPARARLYVFAARKIQYAVSQFYSHSQLLTYCDELPEMVSEDDPESALSAEQDLMAAKHALEKLSLRDRDLLYSRHGQDQAVSRRELADRYSCAPHVIEYAEHRAMDRLIAALPRDRRLNCVASVN